MKRYSDDQKREATRKIQESQSVASSSQELGVSNGVLHRWKRKDFEGASDLVNQILRPRRKLREVEEKRDIPKKRRIPFAAKRETVRDFPGRVAESRIALLDRVKEASRSGCYDLRGGGSRKGDPEREGYSREVSRTFWLHRRRYGTKRISEEPKAEDIDDGPFRRMRPLKKSFQMRTKPKKEEAERGA